MNSRDEALCGGASLSQGSEKRPQQFGRLHVIFFDNTLCHVSCLLKVGVMQILLCMLEAGKAETRLALDDPVEAVAKYSHDPTLKVRARLACGSHVTAVELQSLFLTEAKPFVESGFCDETVPRAREILALWEDTLTKLAHNDLQALIPRLDWVLKLSILDRAVEQRSGLDYASPELKHLDHLYSSLSLEEGLYWAYERAGVLEKVACDDEINRFLHHPPEDTRAWTRAMLLRAAGTDRIDAVDWDSIRIRKPRMGIWSPKRTVELANPLAFSKGDTATLFEGAQTLDEILDRFETSRGGTIVVSDAPLIPSIPAINFVGGGNGYAAPPPQRIAPGRTSEQDDDPKTTKA